MATPPADRNTAVFSRLFCRHRSPLLHLGQGEGGGLISKLIFPQSQELSLRSLQTSPLVKKAVKNRAHSVLRG